MITPTTITNYNRTEAELEEFLMFAILVAGKGAEQQAKKLHNFLWLAERGFGLPKDTTPFEYLEYLIKGNNLTYVMMTCKLGQYKRLLTAFLGIVRFKGNLKNVTIDELESISGIGSKTARFFILHSRPDANVAVLDTHILKWMSEKGYKVPKATPPKKKYAEIEKLFLQEAMFHQMTPADLDLTIWKSYAKAA
jgi:thermostable 8-oxoguanine DNA glycosylase